MYQRSGIFVKSGMIAADILRNNPSLMLVFEHFAINGTPGGKTIEELCRQHKVNPALFVQIANIYNGFLTDISEELTVADIPVVISYLKKAHHYYQSEKYPEIIAYIRQLAEAAPGQAVKLAENYFHEYFDEVREHIAYEENVAFPYFCSLLDPQNHSEVSAYSSTEYRHHHSDIESKLQDFRTFFLEHLHAEGIHKLRRKLLLSLSELESELHVHSLIEERILIPLSKRIERSES